MTGRARANGKGSIYPHRNGFAAYVWVTTPAGKRTRKYVYGPDRETVHRKWVELHRIAVQRPVATRVPTVAEWLTTWLAEEVEPNLAPATAVNYAMFVRLYIAPVLGPVRLDRLSVQDVQRWLNALRAQCQCCAQGKDAGRPDRLRRCCAIGECCESRLSSRSVRRPGGTALGVDQCSDPRADRPEPGGLSSCRRPARSGGGRGPLSRRERSWSRRRRAPTCCTRRTS